MLTPILSGIFAAVAAISAAFVWLQMYDLRFRIDANERKIQAIWNRLNKDSRELRREVEEQVSEFLTAAQAESPTGPDFGEQMLMMMLQQNAVQDAHEPQNKADAIDGLLYGNGGDTRSDGHRTGQNNGGDAAGD